MFSSHKGILSGLLATFIVAMCLPVLAAPQCPPAAFCTPGNASSPQAALFGAGIYRIQLSTLNLTNSRGYQAGYVNRACLDTVPLFVGTRYTIAVTNGSFTNENVRAFADYNNDGLFDQTELILSSNGSRSHSGNFVVPAGAVTGTYLRVRVTSDGTNASVVPTACSTPEFGQVIDFGIRLVVNNIKPTVAFTSPDTINCSKTVRFFDQSLNAPNSWLWYFGDGNVSVDQNPVYTYAANGTYSVKLVVRNAAGADSLTRTNYIRVNDTLPSAAICTPTTSTPSGTYGVSGVLYSNVNTAGTPKGNDYVDFTCRFKARVFAGGTNNMTITHEGTLAHDTRVWIDWNNNGDLSEAGELVHTALSARNITFPITIPSSVVLGRAIRLRISADAPGQAGNPCNSPLLGQVVDITLIPEQDRRPPKSVGTVTLPSTATGCSFLREFKYTGVVAVDSVIWYAGDGTRYKRSGTDVVTHIYGSAGTYVVSLVTYNTFGKDSAVISTVNAVNGPIAATCTATQGPTNVGQGIGITNVTIGTINNNSGIATEGYRDFTCSQQATLVVGSTVNWSVTVNRSNAELITFWIDFNNNGTFEDALGERLYASPAQGNRGTITGSFVLNPSSVVLNTPLRFRIRDEAFTFGPNGSAISACGAARWGQTEDYTVFIVQNSVPPVAKFGLLDPVSCYNTVSFSDSSTNLPDTHFWDFGDGNISTVRNPTHTYANGGTYDVKLRVSNPFGKDSLVRSALVVLPTTGLMKLPFCRPANTTGANQNYCVQTFGIGGLNYSGPNVVSYRDYSCSLVGTVTRGSNANFSLTVPVRAGNGTRVAVFGDWNNDGIMQKSEISYQGTLPAGQTLNSTVAVPANSPLARVRLRVVTDVEFTGVPAFDSCQAAQFGQTLDFSVNITDPVNPPVAAFDIDSTNKCGRTYKFFNQTANGATGFRWSFGDGNMSTDFEPTHTYATAGRYDVKLVAINSFGKDSVTQVGLITVTPLQVSVYQPTCQFGPAISNAQLAISSFSMGALSYNNPVPTSTVYKNNICTDPIPRFTQGDFAPISFQMARPSGYINMVFIDTNRNGAFEAAEAVIATNVFNVTSANYYIPVTLKANKVYLVRFVSAQNVTPSTFNHCASFPSGDIIDFAITIDTLLAKPVASFAVNLAAACRRTVVLTSNSQFADNSKLRWAMGDGTVYVGPGPITHTYAAQGSYDVKLVGNNANGKDSLTVPVIIGNAYGARQYVCGIYPTRANATNVNIGVLGVTLRNINNTSAAGIADGGYVDRTCTDTTTIIAGTPIQMQVRVAQSPQAQVLAVALDFNGDGIIQNAEILNNANFNNQTTVRVNVNVPVITPTNASQYKLDTFLRMRVIVSTGGVNPTFCGAQLFEGQAEDFGVRIFNPTNTTSNKPTVQAGAELKVYPNPANQMFNISLGGLDAKNAEVTITNTLGQRVFQQSGVQLTANQTLGVQSATWAKGIYQVQVKERDLIFRRNLVIE